jgi:hypothetical protein
MRKQLLTAATATTASFIAVIGGLAPAVSAESPVHQPELEIHIPTVETVPEPVPVPTFNPELLGSLDLVHPTIPEEPPVPPADDDGPFPFNPDFELCLNIDKFCPPDIDDFLPPLPGDDDPGDDDPGDDNPGGDQPGDDDPGDDDPGDTPTDDPGDNPGDDDQPGDTPTDDGGEDTPGDTTDDEPEVPESEVPEGNSVPTDIDEPVPGNPSFTG